MSDPELSFARLRDRLQRQGDGYRSQIPDDWRQGRTVYGGLTAGLAVSAATQDEPELPPLRSMIVNFTAPVLGNPRFVPTCLRQGKSVTTMQVTVHTDAGVAAQIVCCFGGSRETKLIVPGPPQRLELPPEDYELYIPEAAVALVPKFATHFETRLVAGSRPLSGDDRGYVHVVSRHVDVDSRSGADSLVVLADILPPAAILMAPQPSPISSITWMLNLLTEAPATAAGWWQLDAKLTAAADGYSSQQMRIWSSDGTLVAEGMQSVAQFF